MTNGLRLHAVEAGPLDGPPVILLHGFPEFWYGWRHQIGPLAEAGRRVVALDQRGYNLSDKPAGRSAYVLDTLAADIAGLIAAVGSGRADLVGHDWGGVVAWWTAARFPDRIGRLAVLNAPHPLVILGYARSHPRQLVRSWYAGFFQLPIAPEALLALQDHALMRLALAQSSLPGAFTAADLEHYEQAWSQPRALTSMVNWYRAVPLFRPARPTGRIRCPTLLIWGARDRFLERGLAEASLGRCERGRLIWHEDATHWVHLEEPGPVTEALIEFLDSRR